MRPLPLIAALLTLFLLPAPAGAEPGERPFTPVAANEWPYAAVRELVGAGYFTGYPAATFSGERPLTRFDFAVALQRMAGQVERRLGLAPAGTSDGPSPAAGRKGAPREIELLRRLAAEFGEEYASLGQDPQALAARLSNLAERLSHQDQETRPAASAGGRASSLGESALAGPARLFHHHSPLSRPDPAAALPLLPGRIGALLPGTGTETPAGSRPLAMSVDVRRPDRLNTLAGRTPLAAPEAESALDARLNLPLGRVLVSGFYKRVGEQFRGADAWMPHGYRGLQGMQGFGGAFSAPVGSFLSLDLEGGALREAGNELRSGVTFVRSGLRVALGRQVTLGLGYERLQFDDAAMTTDVAEQYNVGLGHAVSRNARLELLYQFSNLRRNLAGDSGLPFSDTRSYSAVTQFRIRF
jgi:hypothetical protein